MVWFIFTSATKYGWMSVMHSPLLLCQSVCLWAGYLQKFWTYSDETLCWDWVCDTKKLMRFCCRSGSGYDNFQSDYSLSRTKTIYSTIFQNVLDGLRQNFVDELRRWQEQPDKILIKVQMQIRPLITLTGKEGRWYYVMIADNHPDDLWEWFWIKTTLIYAWLCFDVGADVIVVISQSM